MACKKGIRKSIEASRAFHDRQKVYDPFRELWKSLVERSAKDRSLSLLSSDEKKYFAVSLLEGEIYNGGFDQFFWNSSGDYFKLAILGLEEMEANSVLAITNKAAQVAFGNSSPPEEREKRWRVFRSMNYRIGEALTGHRKRSALEALSKRFCADSSDLIDRLERYANERGFIVPFLKENGPN